MSFVHAFIVAHKISGIEVAVRTGKLSNKKWCFLRKHGAKVRKVSESAKKIAKNLVVMEKISTFASAKRSYDMSYTENITIKNPSRKLEEYLRNVGVKKYLWLQKLGSDDVKPTKVIYV